MQDLHYEGKNLLQITINPSSAEAGLFMRPVAWLLMPWLIVLLGYQLPW